MTRIDSFSVLPLAITPRVQSHPIGESEASSNDATPAVVPISLGVEESPPSPSANPFQRQAAVNQRKSAMARINFGVDDPPPRISGDSFQTRIAARQVTSQVLGLDAPLVDSARIAATQIVARLQTHLRVLLATAQTAADCDQSSEQSAVDPSSSQDVLPRIEAMGAVDRRPQRVRDDGALGDIWAVKKSPVGEVSRTAPRNSAVAADATSEDAAGDTQAADEKKREAEAADKKKAAAGSEAKANASRVRQENAKLAENAFGASKDSIAEAANAQQSVFTSRESAAKHSSDFATSEDLTISPFAGGRAEADTVVTFDGRTLTGTSSEFVFHTHPRHSDGPNPAGPTNPNGIQGLTPFSTGDVVLMLLIASLASNPDQVGLPQFNIEGLQGLYARFSSAGSAGVDSLPNNPYKVLRTLNATLDQILAAESALGSSVTVNALPDIDVLVALRELEATDVAFEAALLANQALLQQGTFESLHMFHEQEQGVLSALALT